MRDYFTSLNDSECDYAVLRNYELLPDDFENDIDILVSEQDFKLACLLTKKHFHIAGFTLLHEVCEYSYQAYWFVKSGKVVHVDLWHKLGSRFIKYADENQLLSRRIFVRGFYALCDEDRLFTAIMKDMVACRDPKKKYIDELANLDLNVQANIYEKPFLRSLVIPKSGFILDSRKNYPYLLGLSILTFGLASLSHFMMCAWSRLKSLIIDRPLVIVFSGPDGSGKSTVGSYLEDLLTQQFHFCKSYHGRIDILPSLFSIKQFLMFWRKEKSQPKRGIYAAQMKPEMKTAHKALIIMYYCIDIFLAKVMVNFFFPKRTPIIIDRYFYDYFVLPEYGKLPWSLLSIFHYLAPVVSCHFVLEADAVCINARKPELTVTEITRQYLRFTEMNKLGYCMFISSDCQFEETQADMLKKLSREIELY